MSRRKRTATAAAILAELKRRDRTRYWLAQEIGAKPQAVYRALDGDCRVSFAERMLKALGIRLQAEK